MTAAAEGPAAQEGPLAGGSIVSELHLSLQALLVRLHEAICTQPRQAGAPGGPGKQPGPEAAEACVEGLLREGRRLEGLIHGLPDEVRCWSNSRLEEELEVLQRQDADASQELERFAAEARALQAAVDNQLRQTCSEICGDAVSVSSAQEPEPANQQSPVDASPPLPVQPPSQPVARQGLRPRLQDLVQDRSRRFVEELEFVQSLANPEYVQWLATQHYFEDPAFIEFLSYLQYWRHPPHLHHVVYPQALRMLEMLLDPTVRCRLHRLDARALLMSQMMQKWAAAEEVPVEGTRDEAALPQSLQGPVRSGRGAAEGVQLKSGEQVLRDQDVLQDWTSLTGVIADKAWHEKLEHVNALENTVQHDAKMIGRDYLSGSHRGHQLERAVEKYRHFYADCGPACDLMDVLAVPQRQPLVRGVQVPTDALASLAPAAPASREAAPAPQAQQAQPPRKRGRRY